MLLHELKLKNIRSYAEETISFPEGSTLLSGDIGSGKSSLLLAIEFGLFGASRPDLPAENLLRKGCTHGFVELTCTVHGQKITIGRNLKRERDAIKQMSGYIIRNDQKKELTPVELKAEMISLLGYPEDLASKNKNYIFRYTVYTPQEAMKEILHEDAETRLDVLRKIFNIDKYKNIRENTQTTLKHMRFSVELLIEKIQPLDQQQQHLLLLQQEKQKVQQLQEKLLPELEQRGKALTVLQQELEVAEQKQKQYQELQQQQRMTTLLLQEKQQSLRQLLLKHEQLTVHLSHLNLPRETTVQKLREELNILEQQRREYLTRKAMLQERVSQLQRQIGEEQKGLAILKESLQRLPEKERLRMDLTTEIAQRPEWEEKKKQLEELLEKTNNLIVKNNTLLAQAKETAQKIGSLETCPTCFQTVSEEHRAAISRQEEGKITHAETLLEELQQKKEEIVLQKKTVQEKLEEVVQKGTILTRTVLEIQQLDEKKDHLQRQEEEVRKLVQENNSVMQQLQDWGLRTNPELLEATYARLQSMIEICSKRQYVEAQLKEVQEHITESKNQVQSLQGKSHLLEQELQKQSDYTSIIMAKKEALLELQRQEKELALEHVRIQAQHETLAAREKELQETVEQLTLDKHKLLRLQELHHWLEEYFVNLTYTMEKHVMVAVHTIFNQFFQEWFAMLIDEEHISSRLDDSFTPIIEQNGHEMTFFNLSGGERTSAALAYRLALNKVINDVIPDIKTKNIIILDEPTDGFSTEQLDKVREVLDKLKLQQTIIVSHESKIESFVEHVIRVEKQGHTSSIQ